MKAFSEYGTFWLLDSPSNRAPGVLNYDPVSGITLDLMGTSRQILSRYLSDEVEPGYLILGILQTGKSVLLEDCSVSSIEGGSQGTGFSYINTSCIVRAIYLDVHFDDDRGLSGELLFDKIIVEFPPLLQWVGVSGLSCEWDQPDASKIAAWFEKPAEFKASVKGSTEARNEAGFDFICTSPSRKPTSEIKLTQTTRFFYTSQDACDRAYLLRQSTAIARLLSVVFDKKVSPSRVTLRQAGEWEQERFIEFFFCPDEYAEETGSREEINLIYYSGFNHLGRMSYDALGGMSFVTKWLELADKNYAVLSRLMSCKFGSMLYLEDKFHQARSAIEAYWVLSERSGQGKQFRPAKKLLVDLVKEAGLSDVAVLGEEPVSWASSVEANRNGYSSHFQRINQPDPMGTNMKKMAQQTDCLYYLTLVLLLKEAGVKSSALDGIRDYVKRFQSIRIS